jgi:hypothetical protein
MSEWLEATCAWAGGLFTIRPATRSPHVNLVMAQSALA